jgi:hypothetical protein
MPVRFELIDGGSCICTKSCKWTMTRIHMYNDNNICREILHMAGFFAGLILFKVKKRIYPVSNIWEDNFGLREILLGILDMGIKSRGFSQEKEFIFLSLNLQLLLQFDKHTN